MIAIGDAGAIRYLGVGSMIDLVGLNSFFALGRDPFELMVEKQVDYVIVFPSTSIDGWQYVTRIYEIRIPYNTILGGDTMVVYKTNWTPNYNNKSKLYQTSTNNLFLLDSIDVGRQTEEREHNYTVFGHKGVIERSFKTLNDVIINDEGQVYTDTESFTVTSRPGTSLIIVKRYDSIVLGTVKVFVDGSYIGNWNFSPGKYQFHEDMYTIPAEYIVNNQTRLDFNFVLGSSVDINSFYYWFFIPEQ